MSLFSARFAPNLLYGIKIWGVWRQGQILDLFADIGILFLLFGPNKAYSFLVPRSIVKNYAVFLTLRTRFCVNKLPQ